MLEMKNNILIIGASRGIGRGLVQEYLSLGWNVYASARDQLHLDELRALGAHVTHIDVTDSNWVKLLTLPADVSFNALIFVAGVFGSPSGSQSIPTREEFDFVMRTNVYGAMAAISHFAPKLKRVSEGLPAKFGLITSGMGSISQAQGSYGWLYRVSKAGLNMAMKAASNDYPNIAFTVIHPGWVKTAMGGAGANVSVEQSSKGIAQVISKLSLNDTGSYKTFENQNIPW